jgi:predicted peptidase
MSTIDVRSYQRVFVQRVQGQYSVRLPPGYQTEAKRTWPLLLFLHGAGERGNTLQNTSRHGPLAARVPDDLPFVIVAPQCPEGRWWTPVNLMPLLDSVQETYRVDPMRTYGTGISMGGTGLWELAAACPDRFAAIAPICGRADPLRAPALRNVPVWIIHGEQDAVIPPEQSRAMAEALRRCGGTVRLTLDPDAGHDVWTSVYADPSFYDWLLSHERASS